MQLYGLWLCVVMSGGVVAAAAKDNGCGQCEQAVLNKQHERKCVRKPQCCEGNGIKLSCLDNPCMNFRRACPRARHCIPTFCEKDGCLAHYYDLFYSPIAPEHCAVQIHGESRRKRDIQPADGKLKHSLGMSIPIHSKKEKVGNCPKSQMNEIIKSCSHECETDADCLSRRKCCWNGCARRCTRPLIKDPTNYLNMPLLTDED